jgi:hypothetical protein
MDQVMEHPTIVSCTLCGEEFSTVQQLELHRREKHPQFETPDAPQIQLQEWSEQQAGGEVF